jgi:ADP-ribose pyrophosphatase
VYDGKLITVHRDRLQQGDQTVEREVVDHPDSVAIVAVNDRDEVLLVRQYRHPVGDFLWELPAGLVDEPEEEPLPEALQRVRSGDITNGLAVAGLLAARAWAAR